MQLGQMLEKHQEITICAFMISKHQVDVTLLLETSGLSIAYYFRKEAVRRVVKIFCLSPLFSQFDASCIYYLPYAINRVNVHFVSEIACVSHFDL